MDLVLATRNPGKLREIRKLAEGLPIVIRGLNEFPDAPEVVEDGATFADNARKKALAVARATGLTALADDSGLTVEVLGDQPGVHSARFAGPDADATANNRKLLEELQDQPAANRTAAFVCVMALCRPDGSCRFFSGRLPGTILTAPRGAGGFGYDPLFWVPEESQTLAELPLEAKNRISHRGQAMAQVLAYLRGNPL